MSINYLEPLSKKELYKLFDNMHNGDLNARNVIAEHNLKLPTYVVSKNFSNVDYDKEDLISIGNIGLMKAIDTFKYKDEVHFATYAIRCINNEILMFLRKLKRYNKVESLDEIIDVDKDGNELKLVDLISSDEDFVEEFVNREYNNDQLKLIMNIIKKEKPRNKKIILLYFGFYNEKRYTQQEIGDILNISRSYVCRIINQTIKRIKRTLDEGSVVNYDYVIDDESTKIDDDIEVKNDSLLEDTLDKNTEIIELEDKFDKETLFNFYDNINIVNYYIKEILNKYTCEEVLIFYLKMGYINNKIFSNKEISTFFSIDENVVIDVVKKILLDYKYEINNLINYNIDILNKDNYVKSKKRN